MDRRRFLTMVSGGLAAGAALTSVSAGGATFWVNRAGLPVEELGASPDGIGRDLHDLVAHVRNTT